MAKKLKKVVKKGKKKVVAKVTKKVTKKAKPKRAGSVVDRLADAQTDWNSAESRRFGAALPDGVYEGTIEAVVIEESRNGRLQCRWDLLVTAGELEGRQIRKFNGLESADNMAWFKGDLETLGLEIPDDLADLGETLEEAQDMALKFQVRSKDEFTNVDFIEPLEASEAADDDEEEEEEVEEVDEEEAEEEVEEPEYTKKEVKAMKPKKLKKVAKELELPVDEYDDDDELRDAVMDMLGL